MTHISQCPCSSCDHLYLLHFLSPSSLPFSLHEQEQNVHMREKWRKLTELQRFSTLINLKNTAGSPDAMLCACSYRFWSSGLIKLQYRLERYLSSHWPADLLAEWLTDWLTCWMTDWLNDWLTGWLNSFLDDNWSVYVLTDWLVEWLVGWQAND
jgi:hypothetical protein